MMARIVKEDEYLARRNEILNVAQRFTYTKGFHEMAIQDILDNLGISKGAFYHYFDSKQALLEALIERMVQEAEVLMLPIIDNPNLPALEKIQSFFDTAGIWKTSQKEYMLSLLRVWYADENAILRQKVQVTMTRHFTPMFGPIIRQGIREGVLHTPFPDTIGEIIISFLQGLGVTFAELLLAEEPVPGALQQAETALAAYDYALVSVLGAPPGSLHLMSPELIQTWFAPSENGKHQFAK
jgi:AcrR family transcriptional regulator